MKWNFLFSQFLSLLDEIQQCLGLGSCGSWLGDLELRAGSFSGRWFQILEVEWGSVTGKGKKPIESMLSVRSPLGATGAHSHWDPPGARVEHTWVLPWKGEGAGVCTHQLPSGFGRRPLLAAGVTINSPAHPSCAVHRQTRLWWPRDTGTGCQWSGLCAQKWQWYGQYLPYELVVSVCVKNSDLLDINTQTISHFCKLFSAFLHLAISWVA